MELNGAKILYTIHTDIPILGDFKITQTLVSTWIVMALLTALAFWLGHDLKLENVSKRQAAAEFIVERLDQFVHENMGTHFDRYIPLVGAIFALSIGCNLISVVGLWSPTADLNTEAAWAIVVFVLILYYKQISEGYEDQARFEIMQRVGMTKTDIRKSINSQLLLVFFLPLLFAGLHLGFAFPFVHKLLMLFNLTNLKLLIGTTVITFAIYAVFYTLVYRITSNSYYSIVAGAKEEAA